MQSGQELVEGSFALQAVISIAPFSNGLTIVLFGKSYRLMVQFLAICESYQNHELLLLKLCWSLLLYYIDIEDFKS